MRTLPTAMAAIIAAGDFQGDDRAVTRVTVQKIQLGIFPSSAGQVYSSLPFTPVASAALEVPGLKSVKWDRSIDSDVGSASVVLYNVAPLVFGQPVNTDGTFDNKGAFSFNRGIFNAGLQTLFEDYLVPDRVVRIYQGYGVDYSVFPENDPHMLLMGCYLIDEVDYTADGLVNLSCRDYGRLLADEIMFPPVVPFKHYPLHFSKFLTTPGAAPVGGSPAGYFTPTYVTDSNVPYIGVNGAQYGHHGTDAFDGDGGTYWLSIGNAQPSQGYSFEYVQGQFSARAITAARCNVWGGPYRVYLSVKAGGVWKGRSIIPYDPNNPASSPNGSNIPYVASGTVARDGTIVLPAVFAGATDVRFTFTDLFDSNLGTYQYRAGVREISVAQALSTSVVNPPTTSGNYGDYTDIVRLLLAYGGFFWPNNGTEILTGATPDPATANRVTYSYASNDPILATGRVWGDLQRSGTAGVADLTADIWDKKPLLDGIAYVRDILGFLFYIDEQGAAQFRSPNIYTLGNWQTSAGGLNRTRTTAYRTITDTDVILELHSKLSSRSLREKVFVGNVAGRVGAVANGRIPYPVNFRRVGGWTDQHFRTSREAQVMADLITLRQLFTYRQDTFRIPADPSIQCDDQVRLVERVTAEGYFHHVRGISSNWDAADGKWTYDLTTSWLGTNPTGQWAFNTSGLSAETLAYLAALGA